MPEKNHDWIYDQVVKTITDISGHSPSEINGQTELILDLGLDSLALFEVVIELEEIFKLQISDEDIDKIKTIDDAVRYIMKRLNPGKQD